MSRGEHTLDTHGGCPAREAVRGEGEELGGCEIDMREREREREVISLQACSLCSLCIVWGNVNSLVAVISLSLSLSLSRYGEDTHRC